jgi:hypothetical protein
LQNPEGQTGKGITKASDIFSFGLVISEPCLSSRIHAKLCVQCIYTLRGREFLLLNDYKELVKSSIRPEQEILIRHFSYFGPVSDRLLKQVNSKD